MMISLVAVSIALLGQTPPSSVWTCADYRSAEQRAACEDADTAANLAAEAAGEAMADIVETDARILPVARAAVRNWTELAVSDSIENDPVMAAVVGAWFRRAEQGAEAPFDQITGCAYLFSMGIDLVSTALALPAGVQRDRVMEEAEAFARAYVMVCET